VDTMLQVLGWWIDHQRNAAGYATLKSRGIRLVTKDSLRRAIAQFYETTYGEEDQHDRIVAAAFDRNQPVFHRYVRQADYYAPAHPTDYPAMLSDPGFRAFLDEARVRISGSLNYEQRLIRDVTALSKAIDEELARRR
jgi:N-acetylmuramoyl-L-alanine amidase